ncbi:lipoprotein localization protein LolB [Rosenbergiella australiborealis]|uniref:Outer-membrane lipoprotein LolB n=1 Tax=Rosenbergiella australiborealis TaxID=1544696 RepID=A0ABS5T2G5_9GAMM|nr:lipoprotein localization protein LolB [Rosenbergiella australiborealis]
MRVTTANRLSIVVPTLTLLLSACVSHPVSQGPAKSPDSPQWKQHQAAVSTVTHFETRGAFAYLSDQQKVYARFNWQQQAPDRYRLLLTSPIGSTELQLDQQGSTVQLVDNKGQRYISHDAQTMITKLTGMAIPLDNLRRWMLGLPGKADHFVLNDHYQLQSADYSQDGVTWHVTINSYNDTVTPPLPANVELTTSGQRIKLRMDSWVTQ